MFNLLSSQTKFLTLLNKYSADELEVVRDNLTYIIKLLSQSSTELLKNRRTYGVLLPEKRSTLIKNNDDKLPLLNREQLLLNPTSLLSVINQFCLTEAIIVRDNFSNCLDLIAEKALFSITDVEQGNPTQFADIKKTNVSPIRLTEIKQRLAQAVNSSTAEQEVIKNKLNNLLIHPTTTSAKTHKLA